MTKKIAVIDPYMITPSIACFNHLVELVGKPLKYHIPQVLGHKTLDEHPADAYIVLGSASHVYQELPWHKPLADFLVTKLHEQRPVLGICFGHQLLCHAFGSTVDYYRTDDFKFTGVRTMTITRPAYGLASGDTFTLTVSHKQVVTKLGPELEELAQGHDLPLPFDLVRHRTLPFLGVQPHPEAIPGFTDCESPPADKDEIAQKARQDGDRLILAFLRHHQLIEV